MYKRQKWMMPVRVFIIAGLLALGVSACSDSGTEAPLTPQQQNEMMILGKDNPGIKRAMEVQEKFTLALMADDDVVGTGTGLTENGTPAVIVYKNRGVSAGLPSVIEGIPVQQRVIGKVVAYQYNPRKPGNGNGGGNGGGKPGGGGGNTIDPTARFARPVPIGVSTGNANECASGTIGCRVVSGENVYALSNNHVFARENAASPGEGIVQPGRYDVSCAYDPADLFATYTTAYPIVFSTSASNAMDAAIALSSTANLGNATPANGYGTPSSAPVAAANNMYVQKYGRTTGQTAGIISGINVTVDVGYSSGTARFVDQIVISNTSRKAKFSDAGDSGSLIVTNDANASPVALLYAGSRWSTIGTPIQTVLNYFTVSIDGK